MRLLNVSPGVLLYSYKNPRCCLQSAPGMNFVHERSLRISAGSFRIKERKVVQL